MAKLHRSGIAEVAHLRQIAVIRGMIADFERPAEKVSSVALGHKSAGVNQGTVLRRPYHEAHYQI